MGGEGVGKGIRQCIGGKGGSAEGMGERKGGRGGMGEWGGRAERRGRRGGGGGDERREGRGRRGGEGRDEGGELCSHAIALVSAMYLPGSQRRPQGVVELVSSWVFGSRLEAYSPGMLDAQL